MVTNTNVQPQPGETLMKSAHRFSPFASTILAVAVALWFARSAPAQPSVIGQWAPVMSWPITAVHMHLLPNGKVMLWPYGDDPRQWDPATGNVTLLAKIGENPFCAGHCFLADGRLFMAGGHFQANGVGIDSAYIYS